MSYIITAKRANCRAFYHRPNNLNPESFLWWGLDIATKFPSLSAARAQIDELRERWQGLTDFRAEKVFFD